MSKPNNFNFTNEKKMRLKDGSCPKASWWQIRDREPRCV